MMAATQPPIHKTGYDDVTKIFILLRESPENVRPYGSNNYFVTVASDGGKKTCPKSTSEGSTGRYRQGVKRSGSDGLFDSDDEDLQQPLKRKSVLESSPSSRYSAAAATAGTCRPRRPPEASKPKAKSRNSPWKGASLAWNDNSVSDDHMDDRDELF